MATLEYRSKPPEDLAKPRLTWKNSFTAMSIFLFLASLTQDAFHYSDMSNHFQNGFCLLLIGWLGLFDRYYEWLANPALLATWILMSFRASRVLSLIAGFISLGFALSFLREKRFPLDEAGNIGKIGSYAMGYWLWLSSIALALIGSATLMIVDRLGRIRGNCIPR